MSRVSTVLKAAASIGLFGAVLSLTGCAAACACTPVVAPAGSPTTPVPATQLPTPACYELTEVGDGPPRTIDLITQVSDSVLLGEVLAIERAIFNTSDGRRPDHNRPRGPGYEPGVLTPLNVQVESQIAGDEQPSSVRVVIEGGEADCIVHRVDGTPRLEEGARYVFFLQPSKDAEGIRHPELPRVVAAWPVGVDGVVRTEEDGRLTLHELETKVREAP